LRFFKKSCFVCHFMISGLVFPAQSCFIDVFCGIFHIRGTYRRAAGLRAYIYNATGRQRKASAVSVPAPANLQLCLFAV
jgi:hypothetical protein